MDRFSQISVVSCGSGHGEGDMAPYELGGELLLVDANGRQTSTNDEATVMEICALLLQVALCSNCFEGGTERTASLLESPGIQAITAKSQDIASPISLYAKQVCKCCLCFRRFGPFFWFLKIVSTGIDANRVISVEIQFQNNMVRKVLVGRN